MSWRELALMLAVGLGSGGLAMALLCVLRPLAEHLYEHWLDWRNRRVNAKIDALPDDEDEGPRLIADTGVVQVWAGPQVQQSARNAFEQARREGAGLLDEQLRNAFSNTYRSPQAPPPPPPPPPMPPGRQRIRMPSEPALGLGGLLGETAPSRWKPPGPPRPAAPWEDLHTFPRHGRPTRDSVFGLRHRAKALSLICVGCELEQPPLTGGERKCPYCGIHMALVGDYVEWWRDSMEVDPWSP